MVLWRENILLQDKEQIVDGIMTTANPQTITAEEITKDSIEKFFNIFVDKEIDKKAACKLAGEFNNESYYIDLTLTAIKLRKERICFLIFMVVKRRLRYVKHDRSDSVKTLVSLYPTLILKRLLLLKQENQI